MEELPVSQWMTLLRVRRAARWMLLALPAGASVSLGIALPLMFSANLLRREFFILAGLLIVGGSLLAGALGYLWPLTPLQAARHAERVFRQKERFSTALEYRGKPEHPLSAALQRDALRAAGRVTTEGLLRFSLPPLQLWVTLALLAAIGVTGSLRVPFQRAALRRQEREAIHREIEAVEALRDEIAQNESLSPEDKARLDAILGEAERALAQAETAEEAAAALEDAKQSLKALSPAEAQALAEDLRTAGEQAAAQPHSPLEGVGQALAEGSLLDAAQQLESLDVTGMDAAGREALAGQLNALAQALAQSDPALAAQLGQAAQALQAGDAAAAQAALSQAAQALRQNNRQLQQAAAAQQATAQLGEGQQRLAAAGQNAEGSAGQQIAGGNGAQGGGQNLPGGLWNGQQNGSGGQAGEGQGSGGAGSGSGHSTPGGEAGDTPIQPGNSAAGAPGGTAPYEPLAPVSPRLGGGEESVTLPGGESGEGAVTGEGVVQPEAGGELQVPYEEALPQYLAPAYQALDDESIPPDVRDVIREYFSSLEP